MNRLLKEQSVLLVDDESEVLASTKRVLHASGIGPVELLKDGRGLLAHLDQRGAATVVLDLMMPHISGETLLLDIVRRHPQIPVVVMTASQEVDRAVGCMRIGAFDYLTKPVEKERFLATIKRAKELYALRCEVGALKHSLLSHQLKNEAAFAPIITGNEKMHAMFRYIEAIATSCKPVMITGETGVGKELLAQAVHQLSGRSGKQVALNVASLDDNMFSDTLFGHVKGAFSGADRAREGMIAQAEGGTLFLDEIGDLGLTAQIKLLRLLEESRYYPLGSDYQMKSNACIVCATNRDLEERMEKGLFREDLFFRLSAHRVHVPPLRERLEDIPLLLDHYLKKSANDLGKIVYDYAPEIVPLLASWHYPGNIRELTAIVHDAVARSRSEKLSLNDFSLPQIKNGGLAAALGVGSVRKTPSLAILGKFPTLKEAESFLIEEAMKRSDGNQGQAALLLGIARQSLNRRLVRGKTVSSCPTFLDDS